MNPDEEDILVENQFSTYWGNTAWSGNPSEGPDFNLEGVFPTWTRYSEEPAENSWKNMRISNPNAYLESRYLEDVCDFWDSLELYETPTRKLDRVTTTIPILTTSRGTTLRISAVSLSALLFVTNSINLYRPM